MNRATVQTFVQPSFSNLRLRLLPGTSHSTSFLQSATVVLCRRSCRCRRGLHARIGPSTLQTMFACDTQQVQRLTCFLHLGQSLCTMGLRLCTLGLSNRLRLGAQGIALRPRLCTRGLEQGPHVPRLCARGLNLGPHVPRLCTRGLDLGFHRCELLLHRGCHLSCPRRRLALRLIRRARALAAGLAAGRDIGLAFGRSACCRLARAWFLWAKGRRYPGTRRPAVTGPPAARVAARPGH